MDDISPSVAKVTIQAIAEPLAQIINSSFSTGIIPAEIKIAKVIPLYKSGERNKISNFRPISILPYFSKFFEKIMYYFLKMNVLSPNQYGFRKEHSTYMALLEIQCKILESIDNREFSLGIFFDLS